MLSRAYVLAGGVSSRFGSDKAEFVVEGEAMAARVARVLASLGVPVSIVSRHKRSLGFPDLVEPEGPRHPLWGIGTALRASSGRVLFAPCDLVDLQLAAVARLAREEAAVHAAGQPLLCIVDAERAALASRSAELGTSVRAFLAATGSRAVDLGPLANLNRPPPATAR